MFLSCIVTQKKGTRWKAL